MNNTILATIILNILAEIISIALFISIFFLIFKNINKKSFRFSITFIFTPIIMSIFGLTLSLTAVNIGNNDNNITVADGFTIDSYEVILDVGIDNKVDVTENININWFESNHHGIYKFTPYWLEYTGKDGKTIKRKSNIINYRAEGENYYIDTVNKKERIKIGDADLFVPIGNKLYTIKYTYDMGKDPFKNFDEFIFHAYGDYWGTEIKNPKIIINMPKGIDGNVINFFNDKYRKENINELINYEIEGNKITITGKDNLHLLKSLTVDIELPENYFIGGSFNYGWISFTISIAIICITIYIILTWIKYGKNHSKRIPTVEFYAPDDLDAAEVGFVYNKWNSTKKLTIALIIQLASKGYLKIDEIGEGKKSKIQLTKNHIKPENVKIDDNAVPEIAIKIEKIKDFDDNLDNNARKMMKYLFKESDTKILKANIDNFLEVKDSLVNGGYINVDEDYLDKLKDIKMKEYNQQLEEYNKKMEEYNIEVNKLPKKTSLENIVYGNLFSVGDTVILEEHQSFYKTFEQINTEINKEFKNKVHDSKARTRTIISTIINIIILFLSITSFFIIEDLDPRFSILYYISFICVVIELFFTIIMGRKTEYGEEIYAKVLGFRNFLETAEKENLESLVEKDPNYFYNILPYTYVLGISKKWVKKFENIPMPDVDMGNIDYNDIRLLNSISDSVYYPPTSGGGGSSSCGGGCSSCGGGCSSCGGGGSW